MCITVLDLASSVSGQILDRQARCDSDIYSFSPKIGHVIIIKIRPTPGVGIVVFIVGLI